MTSFTTVQTAAMQRALRAAASPDAPPGPNPRVGCVILSADGDVLAEGHHRGAGTAHAEVDALANLAATGASARGASVLVTLEPCNHQGRTGPCVQALLDAGVAEVIYAQDDPTEQAGGGAAALEAAGVRVRRGLCAQEAARLNRPWLLAVTRGRPMVTWKLAATLDGRIAAADGTSQWITPVAARHDAHRLRRQCDAIMVGTGTALADDPALTVRDEAGQPAPAHLQPLRVVVGSRSLPPTSRVLADDHYLLLPDHDPRAVLAVLAERDPRPVRAACRQARDPPCPARRRPDSRDRLPARRPRRPGRRLHGPRASGRGTGRPRRLRGGDDHRRPEAESPPRRGPRRG